MEYLDGVTLKNYIAQTGPLPVDVLMKMLDPILQALSGIHRQGLIHRDISPDNIMVLKNGRLKLLDFGAAREVTGSKSLSVVLKPGYAPEEQYRTKGQQGPWTDVYAMCATIYKCITDRTPEESVQRVFEDELKKPSQLGFEIPANIETALMQGLEIKSKDRIQTMDALRKAFMMDGVEDVKTINVHRVDKSNVEELDTIYHQSDVMTVNDNKTAGRKNPTADVRVSAEDKTIDDSSAQEKSEIMDCMSDEISITKRIVEKTADRGDKKSDVAKKSQAR